MKTKPIVVKAKRPAVQLAKVDVSAEISASDMRHAATALDDICDDVYSNSLGGADRIALADVAAWLRATAKVVEPRDIADWDTVQAIREDRETRAANQLVASRHGVGEATVRAASSANRNAKRRIVR